MPVGTTEQDVRLLFESISSDTIDRGFEKLGSSFNNLDIQIVSLDVTKNGNSFEVYPKTIIIGEWISPVQTVDNRFDDYFTSLKGIYRQTLQTEGASNMQIHYHPMLVGFQVGSIDETL